MSRAFRFARIYLVVPLALAIAAYASIISKELLADSYGEVVEPPLSEATPGTPNDRVLDPSILAKAHREKITTRTVRCMEDCPTINRWGIFADLSIEKQMIKADPNGRDTEQKSKDNVLTAGMDRRFGRHLFGVALGASDGEGEVRLDFGALETSDPGNPAGLDNLLNIDRDKYSAGLYYGVTLPHFISLSAQVMASDYRYSANWFDPAISMNDSARYDGDGYSGAVALTAIVPMISCSPRFNFLFQPSVSYQYVRADTDPYTSEQSKYYGARDQRTRDLQFALKWRLPISAGETVVMPYGGFAYSHLQRQINAQAIGGDAVNFSRDHDLLEALLGLTLHRNNFNTTVSFKKTVGHDELERERFQLIFRLRF